MTAALRQMIRRVRRLIIMRGLSLVILAWLAGLAIAMTIDGCIVIYATWARWALSLITYGLGTGVAFWTIIRPLSLTFTTAGLARVIERRHPELNERISSAVELMTGAEENDGRGSRTLIEALTRRAAEDIHGFDPRVEISIRKVMRYLLASATALLVLIAISFAWPTTAGRLALRSTLPVLNLPNIHAAQLSVSPGDTVILKGDRLRVVLDSARTHVGDARLLVEHADKTRQQFTMQPISMGEREGARFSVMTDQVSGDFQYRIRAGDAVTRAYHVHVTPKPRLSHLEIAHDYPAYTGREASRSRIIDGDIRAVAGTEVTVRAVFNKPLDNLALFIDGRSSESKTSDYGFRTIAPDAVSFNVWLEPHMKASWRVEGVDEHGFTARTREFAIESVHDAVPIVRILHPEDQRLQLRPTDWITLKYAIRDDYGVDLAGLIMEADGHPLPVKKITLPSPKASGNRNVRGELQLHLDAYQLEDVRQLAFQLRARDLRPTAFGGPQIGQSEIFVIHIDGAHRPIREQTLSRQTQGLRNALSEAREKLAETRESIDKLGQSVKTDDPRRIEDSARGALDALTVLDQSLASVADSMREGFYDGLRHPFIRDAGGPVVEAAEFLAQIPVADEREIQTELAEAAMASLSRSDEVLESILNNLDEMHDALHAAVTAQDIANRQAELAVALEKARSPFKRDTAQDTRWDDLELKNLDGEGKRPDAEGRKRDPLDDLDHLRKREQYIAKDLADMLEYFPDAAALARQKTRDQLDELVEQVEDLQKKQIENRERSEALDKMRDEWEAAAEDLKSQFKIIEEARQERLLPQTSLPLAEIAADLAEDRLADALAKLDGVSENLEQYRASIAREHQTEELAEDIRALFDRHGDTLRELEAHLDASKPQPESLRDGLRSLSDDLETMREQAEQATPLALKAFELYDPSEDFLAAITPEAGMPPEVQQIEAAEKALAKSERLQAAMETAAQAAEAERLADRLEGLNEEQQTMEHTFERLEDLSRRLTEATAPWKQDLDDFEAELLEQLADARRRQEMITEGLEPLREAMQLNPIAAEIPMEPLTQALPPLLEDTAPASEARQADLAAAEALRAAETLEAAMEQMRQQADAALQRAQDAFDAVADSPDEDIRREAQWRREEAEQAHQRDEQRVEQAEPMTEQLRQIAGELDAIASERHQIAEHQENLEIDRERIAQAEHLAQEAEQRAAAVAREAERLEDIRDMLAQDQSLLLADLEDLPVEDARALARLREEQTLPAASEMLEELSGQAAELAGRQEDMAASIGETQAAHDEIRRQIEQQHGMETDARPQTMQEMTEQLQTLETEMAEMAMVQQALAREAQQVRQQAAELAPETDLRPEELMERAALAMMEDPAAAESLARRAAQEQMQFAEELAQLPPMIAPDEQRALQTPPAIPRPEDEFQMAMMPQDAAMPMPPPPSAPPPAAPPPPMLPENSQRPLAAAEPQMEMPPSTLPPTQDPMDWQETSQRELTGDELIPESRTIPNLGIAQDDVEYDLGHVGEYPPPQELPPDFDLGTPSQDDTPLPFDYAGSPDVQVPPVPQAPQKEAMSGPVPFSDPLEMTRPITELPEIIMPDSFPQAFSGEFSDEPMPPPPPEKSSSLAPAPRLTESDLDLAQMEFVELSAIHIDDTPPASDAGGEAIEEMPDQMLFEPGAQYAAGTPGQSAMPGMELGQLSQAENQDQQSESPAQPDMPSAGGAGGAEEEPSGEPPSPDTGPPPPPGAEPGGGEASMKAGTPSPEAPEDQQPQAHFPQPPGPEQGQQPAQQPPPPGMEQPGSEAPGHEMAHEPAGEESGETALSDTQGGESPSGGSGGSSGESPEEAPLEWPPQIASGLMRAPATEAQLLQEYMERLERHRRTAESLPERSDWRKDIMDDDMLAELITPVFDQLRQIGDLVPRLAPDTSGPDTLTAQEDSIDVALDNMGDYSRELRRQLGDSDPDIEIDAAEHHLALAEALALISRAARTGDPSDAEAAALRMAMVAREAQRKVEEMGLSTATRIVRTTDDTDMPEDELRRLGLPVSDWLRLPGEVRSEVLQAAPAEGPEEYRSLIQRYFSDIARDTE